MKSTDRITGLKNMKDINPCADIYKELGLPDDVVQSMRESDFRIAHLKERIEIEEDGRVNGLKNPLEYWKISNQKQDIKPDEEGIPDDRSSKEIAAVMRATLKEIESLSFRLNNAPTDAINSAILQTLVSARASMTQGVSFAAKLARPSITRSKAAGHASNARVFSGITMESVRKIFDMTRMNEQMDPLLYKITTSTQIMFDNLVKVATLFPKSTNGNPINLSPLVTKESVLIARRSRLEKMDIETKNDENYVSKKQKRKKKTQSQADILEPTYRGQDF